MAWRPAPLDGHIPALLGILHTGKPINGRQSREPIGSRGYTSAADLSLWFGGGDSTRRRLETRGARRGLRPCARGDVLQLDLEGGRYVERAAAPAAAPAAGEKDLRLIDPAAIAGRVREWRRAEPAGSLRQCCIGLGIPTGGTGGVSGRYAYRVGNRVSASIVSVLRCFGASASPP